METKNLTKEAMVDEMWRSTTLGKKLYIKRLSDLLAITAYGGVERLHYWYDEEHYMEVVSIHYRGGSVAHINVTADSNGSILHEIGREVYGDGAVGKFEPYYLHYEFKEPKEEDEE